MDGCDEVTEDRDASGWSQWRVVDPMGGTHELDLCPSAARELVSLVPAVGRNLGEL
jgi:hypothetical protein